MLRRKLLLSLMAVILLLPLVFTESVKTMAVKNGNHDVDLWKVVTPLTTTTSFLNTGAHPDDERSHLLAYLSLGKGVRTGSLIANRGEGGQNEIGSELGNGLGIIRSEELIEASDVTNVDLIMLSEDISDPIYDFGFSKSTEETLHEWGEEIAYERLIRKIREYRPEIVFPSFLDVDSQHGHHRAINVLTERAFEDAADPTVFPEHLEEGLTPWQIKKLYFPAQSNSNATVSIEVGNEIDDVYGKTYAQLGEDSRYLHKSQGMGREVPVAPLYVHLDLVKSVHPIPDKEETIFDSLDFSFTEVAERLERSDNQIKGVLKNVQSALDAVVKSYPSREEVLVNAHGAIGEVKKAIVKVEKSNISKELKKDILFKLNVKQKQLVEVSKIASSLNIDVTVDNSTLVRGATTPVELNVTNDGKVTLNNVELSLLIPEGWTVRGEVEKITLKPNESVTKTFEVTVNDDEKFYHPYEDAIILANVQYEVKKESASFTVTPKNTVAVLPDVAVALNPVQIAINQLDIPEEIEVEMTLTNYVDGPSVATPLLEVPSGWEVSVSQDSVHFEEQGQTETVIFTVNPNNIAPETFEVLGKVLVDNKEFSTTVQTINYDHIRTQYYLYNAKSAGISFELTIPDGIKVGYIESGFDQIADYLINIGMDITKLSNEEIASGDLAQYDSIALGIRAYRREGLPQLNSRLLDYVNNGGHLVVQYHTPNDSYHGENHPPYPLTIGTPSIRWRVTDQNAQVEIKDPEHPLFNHPNSLNESDWENWVQERALYFPSEWDERYETFISMADPGEEPFESGILMAEYGEGTYLYTNLVWYRQIQGQVAGGYRIFTNLISYPLFKD
ncbi:hypothetical protein BC6307_10375 [Sutcliffiella cohnii]|uniref:Alpha-galactosidase NEW3 domain-containing protein n=1 Tax=Sutcliffiella cohnii TaxID=33932 RepID=A0A223KQG8_9BACI|nr:NEW3 domain-containing protein [Sutcliffiella cohnii]AST91656.1 hypothetical protein BC6307_10375 [Sutcliffiella cohnii]